MNLLFSCYGGSRLYGTNTPTSDIDIKHIFLPELSELLIANQINIINKKTNNKRNVKNNTDDVDEDFIPLQRFAKDFFNGQTYALELAWAIDNIHANQKVYHDDKEAVFVNNSWKSNEETPLIITFIKELRDKFLTSNINSMIGYAVNQVNLYSFKGERLNTINDTFDLLKQLNLDKNNKDKKLFDIFKSTSTEWKSLQEKYPKYFKHTTYNVGKDNYKDCFVLLGKTLPFTNTLEKTIEIVSSLQSKYGARSLSATKDNVDWKALAHAVRITKEGIDLLQNHNLTFPLDKNFVNYFLSIKNGNENIDAVKDELYKDLDYLKTIEIETKLPKQNSDSIKEFLVWLSDWMFKFYDI